MQWYSQNQEAWKSTKLEEQKARGLDDVCLFRNKLFVSVWFSRSVENRLSLWRLKGSHQQLEFEPETRRSTSVRSAMKCRKWGLVAACDVIYCCVSVYNAWIATEANCWSCGRFICLLYVDETACWTLDSSRQQVTKCQYYITNNAATILIRPRHLPAEAPVVSKKVWRVVDDWSFSLLGTSILHWLLGLLAFPVHASLIWHESW